ncbi:hypothetical protein EWX78_07065 [Campylobacter coli]|uniref:Uncharacterized protein n=1 Tax=Campylobacter coli TaxID=195 RepID=A0A690LRX0_CAMCO|nr:hypothetical protein [Campylobacter jejuni]EAH8899995.1 hypothetical protein [Campylobacter coli]EAH8167720.1 hypothetical protein [Campylobacter jejuni]EAH9242490.1 hypothetical protein [Campylobacter jejuni]EAI5446312.1 hypothetical protein [Campylobacter coli]
MAFGYEKFIAKILLQKNRKDWQKIRKAKNKIRYNKKSALSCNSSGKLQQRLTMKRHSKRFVRLYLNFKFFKLKVEIFF